MMPPLLRLMRPHQWVKNGFVFLGLLFGHAWNDPVRLGQALAAFAAFCLLASAVYVMNDLIDREQDRPRKGVQVHEHQPEMSVGEASGGGSVSQRPWRKYSSGR